MQQERREEEEEEAETPALNFRSNIVEGAVVRYVWHVLGTTVLVSLCSGHFDSPPADENVYDGRTE